MPISRCGLLKVRGLLNCSKNILQLARISSASISVERENTMDENQVVWNEKVAKK